jgi:8-oxo-dGTP pyrophosphatase MutT (NUDIX family)
MITEASPAVAAAPGMLAPDHPFLVSTARLRPQHAAAAILRLDDGRYLLQHRDALPHIFFPDHWGLFGGALEESETEIEALRRELHEELALEFAPEAARYFSRIDFDFNFCGLGKISRTFYEVTLPTAKLSELKLSEGSAIGAFSAQILLAMPRITPYDAFALWQHINSHRIG